MLTEEKGIVLLAVNYPIYGCLAYNLLVTIRAMDQETPIALVHDQRGISHLAPSQLEKFTYLLETEHIGFGAKLSLDLVTPFKKTLFLDADMAWMPKHPPATLFANLEAAGCNFTAITEGRLDLITMSAHEVSGKYFFWADPVEIKEVYKLERGFLYQWRTEMMYFVKGNSTKKLFARARKIYANPRLKSLKKFGAQVPDELALNIACAEQEVHPHRYQWTPAYWPKLHGEQVPEFEEMYNQYYLLSAGSHIANGSLKRVYDRLVKAASFKVGVKDSFPLRNKAEVIPDRLKF